MEEYDDVAATAMFHGFFLNSIVVAVASRHYTFHEDVWEL